MNLLLLVIEEVNAKPDDKNKRDTNLVVEELCSNVSYNEEKKEPTPSDPPPPSRGLGSVDYLSMRFKDFCDPD